MAGRQHRLRDPRRSSRFGDPGRLRVVAAPPTPSRTADDNDADGVRPTPSPDVEARALPSRLSRGRRPARPWSAPGAPRGRRRRAGSRPPGLRSIAQTTTSTIAPASRSARVASRTAPPVVMTSSISVTRRPATSGPSASLQVPYSLAFLRTNSAGCPVRLLSTVAIGMPPSSRPPSSSVSSGSRSTICRGHPGEQRRVGLEEVLVEVLRRHLARAERELPGQAAAGVDVGARSGRRVIGHRPIMAHALRVGPCAVTLAAMLASRLQGIPPTIFSEMSALAVRTGSVNLGQGFPDVDGPPEVIAARGARRCEGGANQYAPGPRRPRAAPGDRPAPAAALRPRARPRHARSWSRPAAPRAIAAALLGLVDPGDEVVVLEPYYDSYVAMIQMAGGVRRPVTLRAPDFRLDVDELRAAVDAADPVRAAQQPAQPDRHRADPRRARRPSPTWRSSTTWW